MFVFKIKDDYGSFTEEINADDVEQAYQIMYEQYPDSDIELFDCNEIN